MGEVSRYMTKLVQIMCLYPRSEPELWELILELRMPKPRAMGSTRSEFVKAFGVCLARRIEGAM